MKERIIVIGCPGAGKSHFSKRLARKLCCRLVHLDMLYWNSDGSSVGREVFLSRLRREMAEESWIIDGNYLSSLELRLQNCSRVIFLDYPTELCLEGIKDYSNGAIYFISDKVKSCYATIHCEKVATIGGHRFYA